MLRELRHRRHHRPARPCRGRLAPAPGNCLVVNDGRAPIAPSPVSALGGPLATPIAHIARPRTHLPLATHPPPTSHQTPTRRHPPTIHHRPCLLCCPICAIARPRVKVQLERNTHDDGRKRHSQTTRRSSTWWRGRPSRGRLMLRRWGAWRMRSLLPMTGGSPTRCASASSAARARRRRQRTVGSRRSPRTPWSSGIAWDPRCPEMRGPHVLPFHGGRRAVPLIHHGQRPQGALDDIFATGQR